MKDKNTNQCQLSMLCIFSLYDNIVTFTRVDLGDKKKQKQNVLNIYGRSHRLCSDIKGREKGQCKNQHCRVFTLAPLSFFYHAAVNYLENTVSFYYKRLTIDARALSSITLQILWPYVQLLVHTVSNSWIWVWGLVIGSLWFCISKFEGKSSFHLFIKAIFTADMKPSFKMCCVYGISPYSD